MKIPKNVSSGGGVHEDPHQPMAYTSMSHRPEKGAESNSSSSSSDSSSRTGKS